MIDVAILGSGNIGTDLMLKIQRASKTLNVAAMVGIDADSEGLGLARRLGIGTTADGLDGLLGMDVFSDIRMVFDATSARAHEQHDRVLRCHGKQVIDLTPAAIGPYVVPVVNIDEHLAAPNVNLVTCGGQATIPIVAAISRVATVKYAEIIASIASLSAGPGTRANIDEFTRTTALGLERVGGAGRGKAIIILNPADPPMIMRDTVFTLSVGASEEEITRQVEAVVADVQSYVPGFRLKQALQFEHHGPGNPLRVPGYGVFEGTRTAVYLEVEGAGDFLPAYAGNLDIMTASALATGERLAAKFLREAE